MEHRVFQHQERSRHTRIPHKLYNSNNQKTSNGIQAAVSRSRQGRVHEIDHDVYPRDFYPRDEHGPRLVYYESRSAPMTLVTATTNVDVSPLTACQRSTKSLHLNEYAHNKEDRYVYRQISHHSELEELESEKCLEAPHIAPLPHARALEGSLREEFDARKPARSYYSQSSRNLYRDERRRTDYFLDNDIEFLPAFNNVKLPSPRPSQEQPETSASQILYRQQGRQVALRRHVSDSNFAKPNNDTRGLSRNLSAQCYERDHIQHSPFQKDVERLRDKRPNPNAKDRERTLNRSQSLSVGLGRTNNSAESMGEFSPAMPRRQYSHDELHVASAGFAGTVDPYETAPRARNKLPFFHGQASDEHFGSKKSSPSVQRTCAPRNLQSQQSAKDRERTLNRSQSLSVGLGRTNNSTESMGEFSQAMPRRQYSHDELHVASAGFADTVDYENAPRLRNKLLFFHGQASDEHFRSKKCSPSVQRTCAPRNLQSQQSENDVQGSQLFAGMTRYPTTPRRGNGVTKELRFTAPEPQKQQLFGKKLSQQGMVVADNPDNVCEKHHSTGSTGQSPSGSSWSNESESMELSNSNEDASGHSYTTPLRRKSSVARPSSFTDHVALVRHHSDSNVHIHKTTHASPSVRQILRHHSAEDLRSQIQQTRALGRQLSMMSISEEEPKWTEDVQYNAERRESQPVARRREQRSIHIADSPTKTVEVTPGEFAVLRGAKETWDAIQDGFVLVRQCTECYEEFCLIMDADYFLCPRCKCIGEVSSSNRSGLKGGVGLGLSTQLMKTIPSQRKTCIR